MEWQYDMVYVSPNDATVRDVTHDIFHALGRFDEHIRPDRDEFVQINWDEIASGMYYTSTKSVACTSMLLYIFFNCTCTKFTYYWNI